MTVLTQQEEDNVLNFCATGDCYYGSGSYIKKVYKQEFTKQISWPATGNDVLEILDISYGWQSEHQKDLDKTIIPFPGYHPCTINDEIHTDVEANFIFKRPDETDPETPDYYTELKNIVQDGIVWFVLYHLNGHGHTMGEVDLYAVGFSKVQKNRLIGIETAQACRNLCD